MYTSAHLYTLPAGARGFDTAGVVTDAVIADAKKKGYTFIGRYVPRTVTHEYDLTSAEAMRILLSGLGLFTIQHVAPEGWVPSAVLGTSYAQTAALALDRLGFPQGMPVVLDQEGVKPGTPASASIDYANHWHALIAGNGWLPAIYLGWRSGMSGKDAYWKLRFTHYFAAYNLNKDAYPAVRGVQLQQHTQVKVGGIWVDPITAMTDKLGAGFVVLATSQPRALRRKAGVARRARKRA